MLGKAFALRQESAPEQAPSTSDMELARFFSATGAKALTLGDFSLSECCFGLTIINVHRQNLIRLQSDA